MQWTNSRTTGRLWKTDWGPQSLCSAFGHDRTERPTLLNLVGRDFHCEGQTTADLENPDLADIDTADEFKELRSLLFQIELVGCFQPAGWES
jgi:hypothetical protein